MVRTQTIAVVVPPSGRSTTSGLIMKPSASSGLVADSFNWAGELPQLLSWTTCRPRQRPDDLHRNELRLQPEHLPDLEITLGDGARVRVLRRTHRIPNGHVPPGAPVPPGGLNTTTAVLSCLGYTEISGGNASPQPATPSPTTSIRYPSTIVPGLVILMVTDTCPPGSTESRSASSETMGSVTRSA